MDRDELEEDRAAFIAGESRERYSQRCIAGCGCYGAERAIKNPARRPGWIHKLNY